MATIADQMITERRQRADDRQPRQRRRAPRSSRRPSTRACQTIDYDRLTLGGGGRLLRLLRQRQGRHAAGRGPRRSACGDKAAQAGRAAQRLADRQQRHAVRAGLRRGARPSSIGELHDGRRPGRAGLGQPKAGTIFEQMSPRPAARSTACSPPTTASATRPSRSSSANGNRQVPVTGQDATVEGLQNILAGDQCMTVYKAGQEGGRRALPTLAIALLKGDDRRTPTGTVKDTEGNRDVQSVLLDPIAITKDNIKRRRSTTARHGRGRLHRRRTPPCARRPASSSSTERRGVPSSWGAPTRTSPSDGPDERTCPLRRTAR